MAVPLAATLQPIEQPFAFEVGAEAAIIYDTGGNPDAIDQIAIDFYTSGGLDAAIIGSIIDRVRYLPQHPAGSTPKAGDFFAAPAFQASEDFFIGTGARPVLEVIFFWEDISSFFWWSSPFEETTGEVTPEDPLQDFFSAAAEPSDQDFFTEVIVTPDEGETIWDGGATIWDGGATLWDVE